MGHLVKNRVVPMDPKWCETIMCLAKAVQKFEIELSICDPTLILVLSVVHDNNQPRLRSFIIFLGHQVEQIRDFPYEF